MFKSTLEKFIALPILLFFLIQGLSFAEEDRLLRIVDPNCPLDGNGQHVCAVAVERPVNTYSSKLLFRANDAGGTPRTYSAVSIPSTSPWALKTRFMVGGSSYTFKKVDPSLVGYWKFDEGTGTTIRDYSYNHNNGTSGPPHAEVPTWTTGHSGTALLFPNHVTLYGSYVNIPYSPAYNFTLPATHGGTGAFTIALWFKPPVSLGGGATIQWLAEQTQAVGGNAYGWYFGITSGSSPATQRLKIAYMDNHVLYNTVDGVTQIPFGGSNWYHLVFVYNDGGKIKLYINGQHDNPFPYTNVSTWGLADSSDSGGAPNPLTISTPYGYSTQGTIDDVRLYNRALTAAEVLDLYSW